MAKHRIHVFGASGSGTSTLGRGIAERLEWLFLDSDDFYWMPTEPPYQQKRDLADRQCLLTEKLAGASRWVLSGSLCGWGDIFAPMFDLVVFLSLSAEVRLSRLRRRERGRYGAAALEPGGPIYEQHEAFMAWAAMYDDGGPDVRSRVRHELWLANLPPSCEVLRLDGEPSVETLVDSVIERVTA